MPTTPLNLPLLWKGKLAENRAVPLQQPPMILPRINDLLGGHYKDNNINKEISAKTAEESRRYWEGVEKRKRLYRSLNNKTVFDKLTQ